MRGETSRKPEKREEDGFLTAAASVYALHFEGKKKE